MAELLFVLACVVPPAVIALAAAALAIGSLVRGESAVALRHHHA